MTGRSFSASAADEAARAPAQAEAADLAELAGFARSAGAIRIRDGQATLEVTVDHAAAARRAYRLFRGVGFTAAVRVLRRHGGNRYAVCVPDAQMAVARLRLPKGPAMRSLAAGRAFLRGLFLGAGSVNDPTAEHHLEVVLMDPAAADQGALQAARFTLGLHRSVRRGAVVLYLKDGGQIAEFLRLVGATAASFAYEDARVMGDMKSRVNRRVNADNANLNKTVAAAMRQVAAIQRLNAADLPLGLRQVAELRLRHPDLSLRELGGLTTPALSKSGVAHRLRMLVALGEGRPGRKAFDAGE
ncbi:MAG TPA: DNA-binding protein WhiA [Bacillota bacterium]|nr:DNA-binding protein WhiA [Bacillota bacterium]